MNSNVMNFPNQSHWGGVYGDSQRIELVNMLKQINEAHDCIYWKQASHISMDQNRIRVGQPESSVRYKNQGVKASHGRTTVAWEGTMAIESRMAIDELELADQPNENLYRFEELADHVRIINEKFWDNLYYGNGAKGSIIGLTQRYNTMKLADAANASQVVNGGGTIETKSSRYYGVDEAENCGSIWIRKHSAMGTYCFFHKKFGATPTHTDRGLQEVNDSQNRTFDAQKDKIQWVYGAQVKDWQSNVRIPNLQLAKINPKITATSIDLIQCLIRGIHRLMKGPGKISIEMHADLIELFDLQRTNHPSYKPEHIMGVGGQWIPSFRGIPIFENNVLTFKEHAVPAPAA